MEQATEPRRSPAPYIAGLLAGGMIVLVLLYAAQAERGVSNGLRICAQTLIPSLFPCLALSSFLVKSGACAKLGKLFSPLTRLLFGLPGSAAGAIIMSLVGGYPVGVDMTERLLQNGDITKKQAAHMAAFCVNAGPAFTITAVGAGMTGSLNRGVILYAATVLAGITVGAVFKLISRKQPAQTACVQPPRPQSIPIASALVESVRDATMAMLNICAWVLLFSCLGSMADAVGISGNAGLALKCVLEISSGCAAGRGLPPWILAAMLSFSGLCVLCQIMPACRACGLGFGKLLFSRLACAGLSAAYCFVLCRIFPAYVSASAMFSPLRSARLSYGFPVCAALLAMGALVILEVDNKRKT